MTALSLSIDLAAELATITRRQHLNQVHWTVQLVRHALSLGPRSVQITLGKDVLEVRHDGHPWAREEHDLLLAVLSDDDVPKRQAALSTLERRYGTTLLSLFVNAHRVEVLSAWSVVAEDGRARREDGAYVPGVRVRVHRARESRREERRELVAYCRHADVPIYVDGRRIDRPLTLSGALWPRRKDARDGALHLGVAEKDALTRVHFYKQGIYYGLRQSVPEDGAALVAAFSSSTRGFEENFKASTQAGHDALDDAGRALLSEVASSFGSMGGGARSRLRAAVLRTTTKRLPRIVRALALFDATDETFRISIEDLEVERARRGFATYAPKELGGGAPGLPLLSADEVRFLERHLGKRALRRALGRGDGLFAALRGRALLAFARLERAADRNAGPMARAIENPSGILPLVRLGALVAAHGVELVPTEGAGRAVDVRGGRVRVRIGVDAPELARAVAAVAADPTRADVVAALLAAP